jgi:hypothetical protein
MVPKEVQLSPSEARQDRKPRKRFREFTGLASGRLIYLQKKLVKKARLLNVENGWFQERLDSVHQKLHCKPFRVS